MVFRTNNTTCFYCLSAPSPPPRDPRSFHCPHCGCLNRYDPSGEILSDEPAMHDENLNVASFALRASPSTDRLPSSYTKPPFCHTCQTNQMLLVNLLSNYLPPSHHPDYPQRLEQLPAYRDSLHARYPPVCANCLPAVEDQIEQKNQMARTKALGAWLKESKGKERRRLIPGAASVRERLTLQLAVWRVKGALWCITLLCVVVAHAAAIQGYNFPDSFSAAVPILPILCVFSLFYTAWDPTYYHFQKARAQGRDVRIKGKPYYIILQALSWLSRFITSVLLLSSQRSSWDYLDITAYPSSYRLIAYCSTSLVIELLVFSSSFAILHLQRPPTICLIGSSPRSSIRETPELSTHSTRASSMPIAPASSEPDLFASLTLSSKPLASTDPVFGHPSLTPPPSVLITSQTSPMKVDGDQDDAMDWTPTNSSLVKGKGIGDNGTWLRPQRFFPPERPTGLENLFANTKLDDHFTTPTDLGQNALWNGKAIGWWIAMMTVILVPLGTVVYHRWMKGWIQ